MPSPAREAPYRTHGCASTPARARSSAAVHRLRRRHPVRAATAGPGTAARRHGVAAGLAAGCRGLPGRGPTVVVRLPRRPRPGRNRPHRTRGAVHRLVPEGGHARPGRAAGHPRRVRRRLHRARGAALRLLLLPRPAHHRRPAQRGRGTQPAHDTDAGRSAPIRSAPCWNASYARSPTTSPGTSFRTAATSSRWTAPGNCSTSSCPPCRPGSRPAPGQAPVALGSSGGQPASA